MVQSHTTISLEADILKKAQESQINISKAAEEGIIKRMGLKIAILSVEKENCEFCGREEVKASKKTNYIGMTWLCPDEKWICNSCLKSKMAHVTSVQ